MKKRFLGGILSCAMAVFALSGCASDKSVSDDESEVKSSIFEESTVEDSTTSEAQSESTTENEIPVTVVNHPLTCKADGKELSNGCYPEIILSEEYKSKYPNLVTYIDDFNDHFAKTISEQVSEIGAWKIQDTYFEDEVFCSEVKVQVLRADDKLWTLFLNSYDFSGGAHPNHWSASYNVDPATGEEPRLDSVLDDSSEFAAAVRKELEKNYAGITEEVDSFYFNDGGEPDVFQNKLKENTYTWVIDNSGLSIHFSPYEIASYAAGDMDVTLATADYPNLIKKEYQLEQAQDLSSIVAEKDAEVTEVAPSEEDGVADAGTDEDAGKTSIINPTWKKYTSENAKQASEKHISLNKKVEDKTDWLDTEVWANKNGFDMENLTHGDSNYYYEGASAAEYDYMYTELKIYDANRENLLYDFDLSLLCNGPDEKESKSSSATEYLNWAVINDGVLYVSIIHGGYASENPWSNYVVAIDLESKSLLWRSEPLANNSEKFVIVDDTIICGYGFTAEPDYIYLLDRYTGDKVEQIKVNSAPARFEVVGDTLYVATYNTAYEFDIVK